MWVQRQKGEGPGSRQVWRWDVGGLGRSITSPSPPEERTAQGHLPGQVNPVPQTPPVCAAAPAMLPAKSLGENQVSAALTACPRAATGLCQAMSTSPRRGAVVAPGRGAPSL